MIACVGIDKLLEGPKAEGGRKTKTDRTSLLMVHALSPSVIALSSAFRPPPSAFPWTPDPLAGLTRPRYKREGLTLPGISCLIYLKQILAKQREDL
jgi:hypothetical protein